MNGSIRMAGRNWRDSKWLTATELGFFFLLVAGDFYEWVPVTSTPFLLALVWISIRMRGIRWRDIGFVRPEGWTTTLVLGTIAGVSLEFFSIFVTLPLISWVTGSPPDLSDFRPMVGNVSLLVLSLVSMWALAAFGEELVYRGYLMNRISDLGRRTRTAWVVGLLVASAIFGWGHGGQGLTGMVQEGLAGLMLGLLFLATRGNLTVPIIAHGMSNTVAFVLIFLDNYPGI